MRHLSFVDVNYTFEDDTTELMERKPAKKGVMTVKKKVLAIYAQGTLLNPFSDAAVCRSHAFMRSSASIYNL